MGEPLRHRQTKGVVNRHARPTATAPHSDSTNVDAGTALVDRYPDTRFIIDHLAILQPQVPPAPPQPWADLPKVLELAKRKNAVIKVSGACTLSKEPIRSRTSGTL
jgi:predicted TIM-barrel fold metal-dependent hydrolase